MQLRKVALREEGGQALMLVVLLVTVLTLLAPLLIASVSDSSTRSQNALVRANARAAADAGVNDYVAKLLDDNQYYLQYVAPGEATRTSTTNQTVSSVLPPSSPTAWPSAYGTTWTYASKDAWVDLGNGYSYDLEVTAPQTGSNATNYLQIIATGRSNAAFNSGTRQVVQVLIRPASVADFQMLSNATVCYGSGATTRGKIYSAQNVQFGGTAYADIYAEGNVTFTACDGSGPGHVISPAAWYDHSTIRTVIKSPVNFADFQVSLVDLKRAAQNAGGIYLNNVNAAAWWLTLNSNGTVSYKSCAAGSNPNPIQTTQPTCTGALTTTAIPTNGAIYSEQSVVIGTNSQTCGSPTITGNCVKGRVTVASAQDIVVGDDIDYVAPGTDVLGLIAQNNVWVASWVGSSLSWRAAALAENGVWSQPSGVSNNSHSGTMTYTGSTATYLGGAMSMFVTRVYNYDTNLQYLQPPWYPTIDSAYTILLYRNLPNYS
jgi:hypothetical protein